ncbi:MAG TPA: hypothetical protein VNX40_07380 [Mucilaginibacter sp.]|jgi:hypothetical protein|nr:hypothetical protein [Mucilaginibacter sp.]
MSLVIESLGHWGGYLDLMLRRGYRFVENKKQGLFATLVATLSELVATDAAQVF